MGLVSPSSSNWLFEESRNTVVKWTAEENKRFENALALFDKDTPDRWHNVASMIPGKTVTDVIQQYRELVEDVSDIEAGLIPIPGYNNHSFTLDWMSAGDGAGFKHHLYTPSAKRNASTRSCTNDHERKKGVPQFLLGLNKYGKGDWRNISRNFVTSRTPTQVASHAQKYFIRQLSGGKDKRRSSIHDITTVNLDEATTKSPSPEKSSNGDVVVVRPPTYHDSAELITNQGGIIMANSGSIITTHFQGTNSPPPPLGINLHQHLHHLQSQSIINDQHGIRLGHHGTIFQMNPTRHR
ncbi:Duplicated homeodomain-like superfamily protein [Perilla frutescens var. hirtella]|nr:Duplicated homeodomain-like superfamily protein [Perilla frutescens var. hirtella]KAH6806299.1 Duplicated homeodomain-like superfamily protein [Perilla frutescens var. frutescens]